MSKNMSHFLPLLQIIAEIEPQKRQLLMEHLDPKACEAISDCVELVLTRGMQNMSAHHKNSLKKCLTSNRVAFKHILNKRKKNKRHELAVIGGNPLSLIMSVVLPFLIKHLIGK